MTNRKNFFKKFITSLELNGQIPYKKLNKNQGNSWFGQFGRIEELMKYILIDLNLHLFPRYDLQS